MYLTGSFSVSMLLKSWCLFWWGKWQPISVYFIIFKWWKKIIILIAIILVLAGLVISCFPKSQDLVPLHYMLFFNICHNLVPRIYYKVLFFYYHSTWKPWKRITAHQWAMPSLFLTSGFPTSFPPVCLLSMLPQSAEYPSASVVQAIYLPSFLFPLKLLTGGAAQEAEKALMLCKSCSAATKTSLRYQHYSHIKFKHSTAPGTWKKMVSLTKPGQILVILYSSIHDIWIHAISK